MTQNPYQVRSNCHCRFKMRLSTHSRYTGRYESSDSSVNKNVFFFYYNRSHCRLVFFERANMLVAEPLVHSDVSQEVSCPVVAVVAGVCSSFMSDNEYLQLNEGLFLSTIMVVTV